MSGNTNSNYYGTLLDGTTGWNSNTGAFQPGSITDATYGSSFYDGTGGVSQTNGGTIGSVMGGIGDMFKGAGLSDITGLASLLMGGYNAFFGPQADLMKQQIGMLKDQRGYNKEMMQNKRDFNNQWATGSNNVMGNTGLAASAVK